jgi:uncharacterized circularly permuted ATP-grasp superfamily protein
MALSSKSSTLRPRFENKGRMFRPAALVRRFRVLAGTPRMRITLTPETDWGGRKLKPVRGVNHVRFVDEDISFRVTTDAPVSYILSGTSFILDREAAFILGADESLSDHPEVIARDWEERTRLYWKRWARSLAVPFEWQQAVIRAAITLKLCVYEETGGIVAALTTSVPEHEGSERNWDYRYCWIRDAYFTVTALNRLSGMGTLEHYMRWVRNIVAQSKGGHIQPVYGIGLEADLTEDFAKQLPGYRGMGPVRVGNQAAEHVQHDVYGQVVLGVAQSFFDTRLMKRPGLMEFEQLEPVGERAFAVHDTPDAGIWEFRTIAHIHTSSAIMCWAACDRLAKIAAHLGLPARADYWRERADIIHATILEKAWNEKVGAFTAAFGGEDLDASVGSRDLFRRTGITFNVYGQEEAAERLIPFDIVPRVISGREWARLSRGIEQRVRAINAFLYDIYHRQEILRAGRIPVDLIASNEAFLPKMIGVARPATSTPISSAPTSCAPARTSSSCWRTMPARRPASPTCWRTGKPCCRCSRSCSPRSRVQPVSDYPKMLRRSLSACAPPACDGKPVVAVLTPGIHNSAYFEHAFLADQMGAELVEGHDLRVVDGRIAMRTTRGYTPIDVIYRRVDDDFLDPLNFNPQSMLGVPGIMDVYRAGGITIANAPGTGIADDKAIYSYMPDIVEFYTGEKAILKNVPTWRCSEEESLAYVLDHLDDLVVKEVHGSGGYGMLVGPAASKRELRPSATSSRQSPATTSPSRPCRCPPCRS